MSGEWRVHLQGPSWAGRGSNRKLQLLKAEGGFDLTSITLQDVHHVKLLRGQALLGLQASQTAL